MTSGSEEKPRAGRAAARGLAEATAPYVPVAAELVADQPAGAALTTSLPGPPVVAIGASAGGLEALEQFFAAVDTPSRFAFVIIQHLSPELQSLMVELLAKRTALTVRAVENGMTPAADAIHLIPPDQTMTIEAGRLRLAERDPRALLHHPIDEFFVSLAADRGAAAIGIVLSGSGSDGSRGARAIRAAGGRLLVQEPQTATFSSMPAAAITAGSDAEIMPPAAMAQALVASRPRPASDLDTASALSPGLAACLQQAFGIDVAAYHTATLQYRLHRRMMRRGFDDLDAYTAVVTDDPDEQEALYQDLLIGTTGFLRDAAGLEALEREIAPGLAARLDADEEVRIWVAGCATGEEAYAIAMAVIGQCQQPPDSLPLAIFATDIHRRSLAVAGAGFYSEEVVADLRPDWRQRFLTRRGSGWQVDQAIRRTITFSPHDLLREPPFPRLQLISCRNLVRLLEPATRDRLLASFAASLLPDGDLLLGEGENADGHEALFARPDPAVPLLRKKRDAASLERGSLVAGSRPPPGPPLTVSPGRMPLRERRDQRLTTAQELLLDRYAPPSLLVDEAGQVIHCFGDAGRYLETPSGRPSLAVLDMVKDVLRAPLATAINRVERTGRPVILTRLPLARGPDAPLLPRLVVEAPSGRPDAKRCLLVSFDDRPQAGADLAAGGDDGAPADPQPSLDQAQLRHLDALERGQDLERLVDAAGLAAVLLDADLRVRRFTPAATRFFDVLPEAIGRPLGPVTHHFAGTDIVALVRPAAAAGTASVHDLATNDGKPVRLTVTPLEGQGQRPAGIALVVDDRNPGHPAAGEPPFPADPLPPS